MRDWLACLTVATAALIGCGPGALEEAEGESNGTDTATSTDGQGSTSSEGSTSDDLGTTADNGTGGESCPEPDESVEVAFWVEPDPGVDGFAATCTVQSLTREARGTALDLTCMEPQGMERNRILRWEATPGSGILLREGDEVELEWVVEPMVWTNRWFALRHTSDGRLIAAGVHGSALDPPGESISAFLDGPEIHPAEGSCGRQSDECGPVKRVALDLTQDDVTTRIFDHQSGHAGQLDAYRLTLQAAEHQEDTGVCTDLPGRWYQLVVVAEPER